MKKVVVMGSFVIDLTSRANHLPIPGETVIGTKFKMGPGGKGSNQGVAAKRAGAEVTMITKVGNDTFGKIAIENFKNEGFDTKFILIDQENETGTALIMVDENTAQNKILVVSGACANITGNDIDLVSTTIGGADIFLIQLETNMDSIEKSIDIAYKNDVKIVLNTAPIQPVPDELLSKVHVITPNEVEASILTKVNIKIPEDASKAAKVFFNKGVKNVIITLGKDGVYVSDGITEEIIPSYNVNAIDTTGAGDAFNGGFVTALSEGKDIFEAARFGNIVGALSVTKLGTAPAMPYRGEIEEFILKNQLCK